jgi:hypothetical protein
MQIKCFLENNGRIRNVKMDPTGKIYVRDYDGGRLYLYVPKSMGLASDQKKTLSMLK